MSEMNSDGVETHIHTTKIWKMSIEEFHQRLGLPRDWTSLSLTPKQKNGQPTSWGALHLAKDANLVEIRLENRTTSTTTREE